MQLKKQKSIHVWHVMYVGFACVLRMKWIVQTCLEISVTDCGRDLERETIVQGRRTWGLLQQGIWHVTLPLSRGAICCYNHMNVCKTPHHTMPRPFTQLHNVYKHLISTRISQLSQYIRLLCRIIECEVDVIYPTCYNCGHVQINPTVLSTHITIVWPRFTACSGF